MKIVPASLRRPKIHTMTMAMMMMIYVIETRNNRTHQLRGVARVELKFTTCIGFFSAFPPHSLIYPASRVCMYIYKFQYSLPTYYEYFMKLAWQNKETQSCPNVFDTYGRWFADKAKLYGHYETWISRNCNSRELENKLMNTFNFFASRRFAD